MVIKVMGFANFSITSINYHVYIFPLITTQLGLVSTKVKLEGGRKIVLKCPQVRIFDYVKYAY